MMMLLLLSLLPILTLADYACVCNHHKAELPVYSSPDISGKTLGNMYQFDCKPTAMGSKHDAGVMEIQFQNQAGYVVMAENDSVVLNCTGDANIHDLFTTTVPTTEQQASTAAATDPATTASHLIPEGHHNLCPPHILLDAGLHSGFLGQFGENCYEMVDSSKTWLDAERHCKLTSQHGHLLHILSVEQQNYVTRFLSSHHYTKALWIGLNDRGSEGKFSWSSGRNVAYVNYGPAFDTTTHHSSNDCFVFEAGGYWMDAPCGRSLLLGFGLG